MSELKHFTFWVRNERTKESAKLIGQGKGLDEAWKDANANIREPFRPSSSGGRHGGPPRIGVTLPDEGRTVVFRDPSAFEGDAPYDRAKEHVEAPAAPEDPSP